MKQIYTRFRAYQMASEGSSFSYFADNNFTLIEARFDDRCISAIKSELEVCGKKTIDCLHITSWDQDHCNPKELAIVLGEFVPRVVECPGYEPSSDCGKESQSILLQYKKARREKASVRSITPSYINSLESAVAVKYSEVFYHPKFLSEKNNDNSTIKLFRRGCFNVLSLGDVESQEIGSYLKRSKIVCREVDVMILAHHGADNGFTSKSLLKAIKPTVAVCSSNYDNKFDHPRQEIRDLLYEEDIPLYTTKRGDVVIESVGANVKNCILYNLDASNTKVSSMFGFAAKKFSLMKNIDNLRATIKGKGRPNF